jgi:hypothetical protein
VNYALVVITDGRRSCLERTLWSFDRMVSPKPRIRLIINDNPQPAWSDWLDRTYADRYEVWHTQNRMGFCGSVQRAFDAVRNRCDYVFHLEDDFLFTRPVHVTQMARLLILHPSLCQVALKRQAWNSREVMAGGLVEADPDDFTDREDEGIEWLEHHRFWTTNPSLYREPITHLQWPQQDNSEGLFHHQQILPRGWHYGLMGHRADPPWVEHIGELRVGTGY